MRIYIIMKKCRICLDSGHLKNADSGRATPSLHTASAVRVGSAGGFVPEERGPDHIFGVLNPLENKHPGRDAGVYLVECRN